jgi:hypothetical protein
MVKNSLNYMILDIETTDAPSASVLLEQGFARPHAGTKNEDKKAAQVAAKQAKLQESAALLDSSPVTIIGAICGGITLQLFIWNNETPIDFALPGVTLLPVSDERNLLLYFSCLLDALPGVCFVGHNVEKRYNGTGFDLPHLRFRYAFHGLALPSAMDPFHTKSLDLMELFFRSSTTKKDVFVKLEEMAARLGVSDKPFPITGKDVPALWQVGDMEACLLKNHYDLLLTQQVFGRLSHA